MVPILDSILLDVRKERKGAYSKPYALDFPQLRAKAAGFVSCPV